MVTIFYKFLKIKKFLGGSLKIYGVELFPNRPYVTLLLNSNDSAKKIVIEALDKYGIEKKNFKDYVLVEVYFLHKFFSCIFGFF